MPVRVGRVGIWASSRVLQGQSALDTAAELEGLGFTALWVGSAPGDLRLIGDLLGATLSLTVATGIVNVWTEPAESIARAFAVLSEAHPERLLLGLGASHKATVEAATGRAYERPYSKLVSYLDELDAAQPPVPTEARALAALGPRMLALAAARTAGAHPYLVPPEHTDQARQILGAGPLLAPEQGVVLERDPETARGVAREALARYFAMPNYVNNWRRLGFTEDDLADGGSNRLIDALVAWGDEQAVRSRVEEHLAAGADHVCAQVLTTGGAPTSEQYRRLADALLR